LPKDPEPEADRGCARQRGHWLLLHGPFGEWPDLPNSVLGLFTVLARVPESGVDQFFNPLGRMLSVHGDAPVTAWAERPHDMVGPSV